MGVSGKQLEMYQADKSIPEHIGGEALWGIMMQAKGRQRSYSSPGIEERNLN